MSHGQALSLKIEPVNESSTSPGLGMNQEITETPWIKEEPQEQSIKQEEEQLPVSAPWSSAVCVKTEESSLLQQRQNEHREETQGEDINSEPHFDSETEGHSEHSSDTDNDDHWEPFTYTVSRSTGLFPKYKTAPVTAVHSGHMSGVDGGAERKKHQCPFCNKRFGKKSQLDKHIRVHTGERPYSCSVCNKTFTDKSNRNLHLKTHTEKKPYSCSTCKRTFSHKCSLLKHENTHTGEKPYRCSICNKTYSDKSNLNVHMRSHTGEKPYSCPVCKKAFTQKSNLMTHKYTHTGKKPYSCTFCDKTFIQKGNLNSHMVIHTGEKPYSCTVCMETFAHKKTLVSHIRKNHNM